MKKKKYYHSHLMIS
jgi:hypothetical protein